MSAIVTGSVLREDEMGDGGKMEMGDTWGAGALRGASTTEVDKKRRPPAQVSTSGYPYKSNPRPKNIDSTPLDQISNDSYVC